MTGAMLETPSPPLLAPGDGDPLVLRTDGGGVATLTLNRPANRNALSRAMIGALRAEIATIETDPTVRVVILAGAGPGFCAGHDLKEIRANPDPAFLSALFDACSDLMLSLTRLRQPIIAKVHGIATAAGCQLVATCDLAVAAASARFATPGVNIGLFCSTPMVALTRAVGAKAAMAMLLTGDLIGADEDRLDAATADLAGKIAAKSRATVAIGKAAFYRQIDQSLPEAYAYTGAVMVRNLATADAAEGIDAFLAKRYPLWTDR
jgi:enoyl-CoA hydratase/carnithine racemase